jgi:membrane protein involved in colicin uptake
MKKTISNEIIRKFHPCYDPSDVIKNENEELSIKDWVQKYRDVVPTKDIIWLLCRKEFLSEKDLRLFGVWCARESLKLLEDPDKRIVEACNVAERYANGETTKNELDAAYIAADNVADVAHDASRAARAAARDAYSAADYTAYYAAYAVAYAVAYAAVSAASTDAAYDVANVAHYAALANAAYDAASAYAAYYAARAVANADRVAYYAALSVANAAANAARAADNAARTAQVDKLLTYFE